MTLSGTVRSIADYTQRVIISDTASPSHYPCLCCLTSRARLYVGLLRHRSRLVCTIAYLLHEFVTYVGYRPSEPARWMDDVKARDSRELNSRKPVRFKRRRRRRRAFPKSHDTYHWQADKRISRITSKTPPQSKWLLNNKKQLIKKKDDHRKKKKKPDRFLSNSDRWWITGLLVVQTQLLPAHFTISIIYYTPQQSHQKRGQVKRSAGKSSPAEKKIQYRNFHCVVVVHVYVRVYTWSNISLSLSDGHYIVLRSGFVSLGNIVPGCERKFDQNPQWMAQQRTKKRGATSWRGVGRGLILWTWISREKREHTHM